MKVAPLLSVARPLPRQLTMNHRDPQIRAESDDGDLSTPEMARQLH
jgi:hypothetical protein